MAKQRAKPAPAHHTLVLRRRLGELKVFDAIDELARTFRVGHALSFKPSIVKSGKKDLPCTGYVFETEGMKLVFCEDYSTGVSYIEISASDDALASEALAIFRALPQVVPAKERPLVRKNYRKHPGLLVALVMAEQGSRNPATAAIVRDAMKDDHEEVRFAAATAAAQAAWPELREDVERLKKEDPAKSVRSMASLALKHCASWQAKASPSRRKR
jgi:hypothetical protein